MSCTGSTTATDSCNNEGIIVNKKELEGTISSGESKHIKICLSTRIMPET